MLKQLQVLPINNVNCKFDNMIKLGKDKYKKEEISNIVYKINCKDCESTYIGQSGRKLQIRVDEHKKDVKKCKTKSALYKHMLDNNCKSIDFDNVKIIDRERNKSKRLFSEMFHIEFFDNTMNRMSDCNGLQYIFKSSIDNIKKYVEHMQY